MRGVTVRNVSPATFQKKKNQQGGTLRQFILMKYSTELNLGVEFFVGITETSFLTSCTPVFCRICQRSHTVRAQRQLIKRFITRTNQTHARCENGRITVHRLGQAHGGARQATPTQAQQGPLRQEAHGARKEGPARHSGWWWWWWRWCCFFAHLSDPPHCRAKEHTSESDCKPNVVECGSW